MLTYVQLVTTISRVSSKPGLELHHVGDLHRRAAHDRIYSAVSLTTRIPTDIEESVWKFWGRSYALMSASESRSSTTA